MPPHPIFHAIAQRSLSAFASEWRPYESAHPRLFDGIRHWHLHAGVVPVEQTKPQGGCDVCDSFILGMMAFIYHQQTWNGW